MHAVFFQSDAMSIPDVTDQSIVLFEDREAARDFMFKVLCDNDCIEVDDGPAYRVGDERYDDPDDAIDAAQEWFSTLEYLHDYEVVDRR